jgi:hypothetical protein
VTSSTEEFTEFAAGAAPRLRRTAFLLCGDWHAAEDLAQATLAKMFVSWRRIGPCPPCAGSGPARHRDQGQPGRHRDHAGRADGVCDERRDTSGGIGASVSQVGVVTPIDTRRQVAGRATTVVGEPVAIVIAP